jgi:hemoglobin-like flavoprotein/tRNA A-37 threonylcarbamoyl transferase component Bud32
LTRLTVGPSLGQVKERSLSRGRETLKPRGRRGRAGSRAKPAPVEALEGGADDPILFVSYSHSDAEWVEDAERHLRNVAETCGFRLFVDRGIRPGESWPPQIEGALRRARAAVVFLSNHYLDTERYAAGELNTILTLLRQGKLTPFVVPVDDVDPYLPKNFEELHHIQWALPKDRPIARLRPEEREDAFRKLNEVIGKELKKNPQSVGEPRTLEEFAKAEVQRTLDSKYEIQESLGAGRSSVVFRARDTSLGRDVALKVLVQARYEVEVAREFVERAQIAAGLRHPSIVQVLTSQLQSLPYYLVMECIEGSTLEATLSRKGSLDSISALRYFDQVASALGCIHERGMVHGAIRPSHILFDAADPKGRAVLSVHWLRGMKGRRDSGLSLEELTYMTPEQYDGESIDARSDQYQLGQLLCELLTGDPPAEVSRLRDFEKKQASFAKPLPASLDRLSVGRRPAFREALGRMLSRDPPARWPSISEASGAIREVMEIESSDLTLQLARRSFDRCAAGTSFFPLIYKELFALRPDLERLFHATDLERQYVRLRAALVALFEAGEGTAAVRRTIEDYGRQHARWSIGAEDYDAFLQAICRAAKAAEGVAWTPALEEAWPASLRPGIEEMKRLAKAGG